MTGATLKVVEMLLLIPVALSNGARKMVVRRKCVKNTGAQNVFATVNMGRLLMYASYVSQKS